MIVLKIQNNNGFNLNKILVFKVSLFYLRNWLIFW